MPPGYIQKFSKIGKWGSLTFASGVGIGLNIPRVRTHRSAGHVTRDGGDAVHKFRLEKNVGVVEHAVFERHHDELQRTRNVLKFKMLGAKILVLHSSDVYILPS